MIVGLPASEFVVLDVETTGLDPAQGHEIIEVAAQKIKGRGVIGQYVALAKPSGPLPTEVVAFHANHGLTAELLKTEGQPIDQVMQALMEFIGSAVIIAHNAAFDLGFVNAHLQRLGQPPLKNQTIDTIEIAKRYLILSSYRLSSVATFLKVPQSTAHRALADVETTREVFFKLIDRAKQKTL